MTDEDKLIKLEELFDLDAGSIAPDTLLDDLEEWDSVNKLTLIIFMDEEFDRAIDGDDIKTFSSISDIMQLMRAD